jgi:transcriptional regulator with XRE-family HTH domain
MTGTSNDCEVTPRKSDGGASRQQPSKQQLAFGHKLAELRKQRGLRQRDVASSLDVTPAMVSDWENGKVEPSPPYQRDLAAYYGVSLEYLWGGNSISGLAGGGVLPAQLKNVVTSAEWEALPDDVRHGMARALARVDLPDFEVRMLLAMLTRGHDAYAARKKPR